MLDKLLFPFHFTLGWLWFVVQDIKRYLNKPKKENIMRYIPLAIFALFKFACAVAYVAIIVYLFNYSIAPLLKIHGGWNFLFTMAWSSIACMVLPIVFFWMPKPKRPQATYRDKDTDINNPFPLNIGDE